jgi:pimeloyl-ACP methyl ester carboxylesterase
VLDRGVLIGHSWGAWVACHAAATAPARITALVLLDGGYTDPRDWSPPPLRIASRADCVELGRKRGLPDPETWAAAFFATLQRPYASATYAALAAANVPVLLLAAGEHADASARQASARGLERLRPALPDADVRVLGGVGHEVLAEARTAAIVAEWLEQVAAGAGREAAAECYA